MGLEMVNKPRGPSDFAEARIIVGKRLIEAPMKMGQPNFDIELFMQFTTILDALKIAEAVTRAAQARAAQTGG